ncbi:unnamed protein product [Aphanomyces euteiches]
MLRDECKLLLVLPLHAICFAPAILFTSPAASKVAFFVYLVALSISALFSLSSVCKQQWHVHQSHICWLSTLFWGFHAALHTICIWSLYGFLEPFLSTNSFADNCSTTISLRNNVAKYPCQTLQQFAATSLVLLPVAVSLGSYAVILGSRIAKKQSIEYARVKKEIERHSQQHSPSNDSLLQEA